MISVSLTLASTASITRNFLKIKKVKTSSVLHLMFIKCLTNLLCLKPKILNKLGIEGSDHNIIKVIYEKSTSNILINEKLKTSKIKKKRLICQLSTLLFNKILEVLARALA